MHCANRLTGKFSGFTLHRGLLHPPRPTTAQQCVFVGNSRFLLPDKAVAQASMPYIPQPNTPSKMNATLFRNSDETVHIQVNTNAAIGEPFIGRRKRRLQTMKHDPKPPSSAHHQPIRRRRKLHTPKQDPRPPPSATNPWIAEDGRYTHQNRIPNLHHRRIAPLFSRSCDTNEDVRVGISYAGIWK